MCPLLVLFQSFDEQLEVLKHPFGSLCNRSHVLFNALGTIGVTWFSTQLAGVSSDIGGTVETVSQFSQFSLCNSHVKRGFVRHK
jgi:hypothetical protein